MKISATTIAASALALVGLCAQAFELPENVPDATFSMPINPADKNSATVNITGTIQHAVAQMEADHPGWTDIFMAQAPSAHAQSTYAELATDPTYDCSIVGDGLAKTYYITQGISYLNALPGDAQNDPGKCGRVSCSYNAAISWCNTSKNFKTVPWWALALATSDMIPQCDGKEKAGWMKGRADYANGWEVVVHGDPC
ncbi:hypothetical protein QBC40DRAFT_107036 [Triangularia verruculosa]|uniref:Uncharacterized protein n=1 Tax=Triangularia verruculosa TaxID=2587418 RepID=A0AAN6XB52_9PEZI|nr:hypothetical protein QBC40DRAFT_107036 [Triangularia verruculosa]